MSSFSFSAESLVAATPEQVWQRITTPEGVNGELMPIVRMTWPRDAGDLTPENVQLGTRLFRSWILLFGVLPIDYDDITVVELEPGRRFLERSTMLSQRRWQHERTLEPVAPRVTRVIDRVEYEPRFGLSGALFAPGFRATFAWRHRRLRRHFGMPDTALLYDSDCGFCRTIVGGILALDRRRRLRPVAIASDAGRALTPGMSDEQRARSFHLVHADGTVLSGGAALAELMPPLGRAPRLADAGYRAVADRRHLLGPFVPAALKARADRRIAARGALAE